jgi:hypothetical protein
VQSAKLNDTTNESAFMAIRARLFERRRILVTVANLKRLEVHRS